jgi:hypothetical protein
MSKHGKLVNVLMKLHFIEDSQRSDNINCNILSVYIDNINCNILSIDFDSDSERLMARENSNFESLYHDLHPQ